MCGLAGVAGLGIRGKHMIAMRQLLYITALRGKDSTGVAAIFAHHKKDLEEYTIVRELGDSTNFIRKDFLKTGALLWDTQNDIVMAHCRDATVGKVTVENAHPFDTGKIIGAHNGTLEHKDYSQDAHKTDSELLFEAMSKRGVVKTLNTLGYRDAYAVSIYEKNSEILQLARNPRRTLFIGVCKDDDVLFWSSEQIMLEFISERCDIDMDIYSLVPWRVYSFNISEIKKKGKFWTTQDLEEKTWESVDNQQPGLRRLSRLRRKTETSDSSVASAIPPWDGVERWEGEDLRSCAVCPCCEKPTRVLVQSNRGMLVCESCDTYLQYNT